MKTSRLLIAAGASGSGKTLITCGILQALIDEGYSPCAFKCGPDFIDPMFHSRVIGAESGNLDAFFCSDNVLNYILETNSRGSDISVIEGVMGFYDGVGGISTKAGAYDLARITDTPVLLVVNGRGMSGSMAAFINGFKNYREDSHIKGVILNQISPAVYEMMKDFIERECNVRVYGYLPRIEDCLLESRHLGLVTPDEIEDLKVRLKGLSQKLRETVDIEGIIRLAETSPDINASEPEDGEYGFRLERPVKIALARDGAFSFIYEDNLRLLRKMGAEIVEFSPVNDRNLPEGVQGIILYGGYPELYAEKLEANSSMKESILKAAEGGMPLIAECGGFIYLHEEFEDNQGFAHRGVGLIKGRAFKTSSLVRFGYIYLDEKRGNTLGRIPAHEFHYYDSESNGSDFRASKASGKRSWQCIHRTGNLMVGFPHIYYYGNPAVASEFLRRCRDYSEAE